MRGGREQARGRTRGHRRAGVGALALALLLDASPVRAQPPSERTAEAPGGYWGLSERRPAEPRDGAEEIVSGSILVPLGTLRAGAGVATYFAGTASRCDHEANDCSNIRYVGIAGMALGGLMFTTGIVLLIVGLARRERHRRWKLEPWARLRIESGGDRAVPGPALRF